ncbi:hypothetical protein FQV43_03340 [Corynebacterium sp. sy039]|nr:hypothetical protein FQV43_03340 [Corynebacterium sp. sy039]
MTYHSMQKHRAPSGLKNQGTTPFFGIPLWCSLLIFSGALLIGLFISVHSAAIGVPYFVLFVIAAIGIALVTRPQDLFLTVSSIPIIFGIFTILTGWWVVSASTTNSAEGISKTRIITAVYPLAQHFPIFSIITVAVIIIAFLRIRLLQLSAKRSAAHAQEHRIVQKHQNQRNVATAQKARSQTQRVRRHAKNANAVTVEELLRKKNRSRTAKTTTVRDPQRRQARTYAPRPQRTQQHTQRDVTTHSTAENTTGNKAHPHSERPLRSRENIRTPQVINSPHDENSQVPPQHTSSRIRQEKRRSFNRDLYS